MVIENPIIVALDRPSAEDAVRVAQAVAPYVGGFKVGLGLLHGPGPGVIGALARLERPVFADAKLHDIPSQIEQAAYRLADHGARWVTAHLSGGLAMVEAAVAGLERGAGGAAAGILGVSVLTSLDDSDFKRLGVQRTTGQLVGKMARVAMEGACEGIVSSPQELNVVRQAAPELLRVTPGIRPVDVADDQARVATPAEAISKGADLLVIGRPIAAAEDPAKEAEAIWETVTQAMSQES